ncbi:hypothetical protein BBH88_18625 (plasmid) [Planococcus antarcticus DSM 14505]|uniref:YesK-like protein n=1 Tax=Planococcus antarcticus DSM 14505 TaxID=1185653 RepID=A0ABN4RPA9_9BACL|nr:YesK family protein [Planococcus antarcticus]ANU12298.1 hypothetical protein BBH88_18510 [Planococcus antarcticus DSM 14505]ANU12318.1 hypothetical protein BBH88_18625 [Planococcus antarcticus DSM 14505]
MDLIIIGTIISLFLVVFSWIFYKRNSPFQYIIPLVFAILSIIVIIWSLDIGGWDGMGLGVIGLVFLGASIIVLLIISVLNFIKAN